MNTYDVLNIQKKGFEKFIIQKGFHLLANWLDRR